jgi:hypothetical protein
MHKSSILRENVEESLRQLETDSVDIFYLHAADRSTPFAETLNISEIGRGCTYSSSISGTQRILLCCNFEPRIADMVQESTRAVEMVASDHRTCPS